MILADRLPTGGLRLLPADRAKAAQATLASMFGVTLFIVALDLTFRPSPDYIAYFTSPLMPRTLLTCALAALEEVTFRLVLMTALITLLTLWRGKLSASWFVAAILLSQFANVGTLVIADPVYASLRYWAVGCVWGWLYWRHGWVAALVGHSTTHLLLDPLLYRLL